MPGRSSFVGGTKSVAFVRDSLVQHEKLWHGQVSFFPPIGGWICDAQSTWRLSTGDGKRTVLKNPSHELSQGKRVIPEPRVWRDEWVSTWGVYHMRLYLCMHTYTQTAFTHAHSMWYLSMIKFRARSPNYSCDSSQQDDDLSHQVLNTCRSVGNCRKRSSLNVPQLHLEKHWFINDDRALRPKPT